MGETLGRSSQPIETVCETDARRLWRIAAENRVVDCAPFVAQDAYAWPASQQYAVIAPISPIARYVDRLDCVDYAD
ncbi:hypothetical protein [Burkholderia multivorans]|uniref:hypothetical protein n=1 Tax=Burkholderia multivorans TaxID=87883 RepID=UPI0021BEC1DC|nr:hypothetical protein [Burkholderia multivorans]